MPKFTKKNLDVIKVVEQKPLSDEDIINFLPPHICRIIIYEELKNYTSFEQLFQDRPIVLLLYPVISHQIGHWVILIRFKNPEYIEFNCSYGSKVDEPLMWISQELLHSLGIKRKYLSELFKRYKYTKDSVYNHIQFQKKTKGVSTCGRFAVLRGILYLRNKFNLLQYQTFMKNLKKELKQNYDFIASGLINEATKKKQI